MSSEDSPIKIDFSKQQRLHGLAKTRGLPDYLLSSSMYIDPEDIGMAQHEYVSPVSARMQLRRYRKTLLKPTYGSYLMVISSMHEEKAANLAAVAVYFRAIAAHVTNPANVALPLYHSIFGGRFDRLRDDDAYRRNMGKVSLLVLANVAENSTQEKIEKARDLLSMYSSIPRILVVSGLDPLKFSLDKLYKKPNRILWLGSSAVPRSKTISV